MVKHGRAKKARSSSRQNGALKSSYANAKFKNPNKLFTDLVVKSKWDPRKSALKNLAEMGLKTGVNDTITNKSGQNSTNSTHLLQKGAALTLYDIPPSGVIPKRTKADVMLPVSVDDQKYIKRLLTKHKLNYMKMFRDPKLNDMQHTAVKLEKLAVKFFKLKREERVVEVDDLPAEVREVMAA